jgi:hypothetical protein
MPDSIPRPIVWSTQLLSGYTRRELTGRQRAIFNEKALLVREWASPERTIPYGLPAIAPCGPQC